MLRLAKASYGLYCFSPHEVNVFTIQLVSTFQCLSGEMQLLKYFSLSQFIYNTKYLFSQI